MPKIRFEKVNLKSKYPLAFFLHVSAITYFKCYNSQSLMCIIHLFVNTGMCDLANAK